MLPLLNEVSSLSSYLHGAKLEPLPPKGHPELPEIVECRTLGLVQLRYPAGAESAIPSPGCSRAPDSQKSIPNKADQQLGRQQTSLRRCISRFHLHLS
jgi:hypothetical protein